VLKVLSDPAERVARRRMSINLNLSTLSSQKFVKFDADLPPEQRQDVVLEISKTDIFENMRLYRKLTPFLRERGYRVLLDGLTMESALAIDFDGIDCDFAKVFWAAEAANYTPEQFARIKAKLARKKPRIVLARCDTAESARFAKSVGISLVQGRLIDHMVKKNIPL
jgi:EAL domain-containing protein (putative c-di-GMP-specific phosphodiesterase class I)